MAEMVPRGMDLDGSFRSPERLQPAMMPVTEGKNRPYRYCTFFV